MTASSLLLPLAEASAMSWGYLATTVVGWLITTALTWVVAARITNAVLREQNQHLQAAVEALIADVRALSERIGEIAAARAQCELRAARTYADRGELAQVLVESTSAGRRIVDRLGGIEAATRTSVAKAHGRVDGLQERVTRNEERIGRGRPADGETSTP